MNIDLTKIIRNVRKTNLSGLVVDKGAVINHSD